MLKNTVSKALRLVVKTSYSILKFKKKIRSISIIWILYLEIMT